MISFSWPLYSCPPWESYVEAYEFMDNARIDLIRQHDGMVCIGLQSGQSCAKCTLTRQNPDHGANVAMKLAMLRMNIAKWGAA